MRTSKRTEIKKLILEFVEETPGNGGREDRGAVSWSEQRKSVRQAGCPVFDENGSQVRNQLRDSLKAPIVEAEIVKKEENQ